MFLLVTKIMIILQFSRDSIFVTLDPEKGQLEDGNCGGRHARPLKLTSLHLCLAVICYIIEGIILSSSVPFTQKFHFANVK